MSHRHALSVQWLPPRPAAHEPGLLPICTFLLFLYFYWLTRALQERYFAGGLIFAALLNFKHIFLYLAPVQFVFLLRVYCYHPGKGLRFGPLLGMGAGVLAIFALSLGPFAAAGQLGNLIGRLFPFKRGLIHAYWAPNVWALYAAADRVGSMLLRALGHASAPAVASVTRGIVGDVVFATLPNVTPLATLICTAVSMIVRTFI